MDRKSCINLTLRSILRLDGPGVGPIATPSSILTITADISVYMWAVTVDTVSSQRGSETPQRGPERSTCSPLPGCHTMLKVNSRTASFHR